MPKYTELLKQRPADIIPPKPVPAGSYLVEITNYVFGTFGKNDTECVNFQCKLIEPGDDVDPAALQAAKDDLVRAKPTKRYYLTEESLFMLKQFLQDVLKIPEGETLEEMIPQSVGKRYVAVFVNQPSEKDSSRMISFIDKVLPAS